VNALCTIIRDRISYAMIFADLYLSPSATNHVNLPSELQQELLRVLRPYLQLGGLRFETTQQHLLERMYAGSFQVSLFCSLLSALYNRLPITHFTLSVSCGTNSSKNVLFNLVNIIFPTLNRKVLATVSVSLIHVFRIILSCSSLMDSSL
jgi:hypothetical protein